MARALPEIPWLSLHAFGIRGQPERDKDCGSSRQRGLHYYGLPATCEPAGYRNVDAFRRDDANNDVCARLH